MAIKYLDAKRVRGIAGKYTQIKFTGTGVFTPAAGITVNYLVVGGGAGGGKDAFSGGRGSGGGGAGGYRESGVTTNDTAFTSAATAYTITIGGAGSGASSTGNDCALTSGGDGGNSSISGSGLTTIASKGGGGGGGHGSSQNCHGRPSADSGSGNTFVGGGSGGGASNGKDGGASGTYGYNGGGAGAGDYPYSGGGGGGASQVGEGNGIATAGTGMTGDGGDGRIPSTNYFTQTILAAGAAGQGVAGTASGGQGGGGNTAVTGSTNTGSGGGGGRSTAGGDGGSGLVIISVPYGSSYTATQSSGSPTVASYVPPANEVQVIANSKETLNSSASSGWKLNEGGSGQTITGGYLNTPSGARGYKAYAFGSPTNFVMDFDWGIDGDDSPAIILSSSFTGAGGGGGYGDPNDGQKRLLIYVTSSGMRISSRYFDGTAAEDNVTDGNNDVATDGTIAYYRFVKTGSNMNLKRYATDAHRTAGSNVLQTCNIATINGKYATTAGYGYLFLQGHSSDGANKLYDWKFWTGMTSPSGDPTFSDTFVSTSDLPENTIFEQTDAYKYYFLQSNEWVIEA